MNPFIDLNSKTGLLRNERSPYFARYRLNANQVSPFREPTYNRVVLKVRDIEMAKEIHEWFHDSLHQLFHLFKQSEIRANTLWQLDFFDDEQCFLVFEMMSDVKYIAVENIYFAFYHFALILEDCYFFIYSTGDGDERWLDEYKIINNTLIFQRNLCDSEIHVGRLNFYIDRANNNPNDDVFKQFTLFQIYDRLKFWTNKDIKKYSNKNKVIHSTLSNTIKHYFMALYSLDDTCSDLTSLNKKYRFNTMKL